MAIQKARRNRKKGRILISGDSGSGKSYSALMFSVGLIQGDEEHGTLTGNGLIGVIDTEKESSSLYAKVDDDDTRPGAFDFDVIHLNPPFTPEAYIEALQEFERAGYSVVIIDQMSSEWEGTGGILQAVNDIAKGTKSNNTYAAWMSGTPRHDALTRAINASSAHVFVLVRGKEKAVLQKNDKGKMVPVSIGMQPIQRKNIKFEFDAFAVMNYDISTDKHYLNFRKAREGATRTFMGQTFVNPDGTLGKMIGEWLRFGNVTTTTEIASLDPALTREIQELFKQLGYTQTEILEGLTKYGATRLSELSVKVAGEIKGNLARQLRNIKANEKARPAPKIQPEPEELVTKYWISIDGSEPVEMTAAQVNAAIDQGVDPAVVQAMHDGGTAWLTLADYGFRATAKAPAPAPAPKTPPPPPKAAPKAPEPATSPPPLGYWATIDGSEVEWKTSDDISVLIEDGTKVDTIQLMQDGGTKWIPAHDLGFRDSVFPPTAEVLDDKEIGEQLAAQVIEQSAPEDGLGDERAYVEQMAEYLGYSTEKWGEHLSKFREDKMISLFDAEQLAAMTSDMDSILADKEKCEADGTAFNLDDWYVGPPPAAPAPEAPKKPRSRPKK